MRLLAPSHARILALADRDLDDLEIARRLALDPAAVGPALRVARAKLAALEAQPDSAAETARSVR